MLWCCWLGGRNGIRPVKNWVVGCWRGCLERGADLHMAQLMPLPLTVSCFSIIQIGFTFLLPAHLGSPGQRAIIYVCVWHSYFSKIVSYSQYVHLFNGPFSGTTRVSQYQKGKTNLDFAEARDSEWQWHQLGHVQVCTSLQTEPCQHPTTQFFTGRMPFLPYSQVLFFICTVLGMLMRICWFKIDITLREEQRIRKEQAQSIKCSTYRVMRDLHWCVCDILEQHSSVQSSADRWVDWRHDLLSFLQKSRTSARHSWRYVRVSLL